VDLGSILAAPFSELGAQSDSEPVSYTHPSIRALQQSAGTRTLGFSTTGGGMAKNAGDGSRTGSVTGRTQVKNPVTGDYVKRDEDGGATGKGKFMDVKQDGSKFKGVATEPDGRRKKG
jgi:hypothetical protein